MQTSQSLSNIEIDHFQRVKASAESLELSAAFYFVPCGPFSIDLNGLVAADLSKPPKSKYVSEFQFGAMLNLIENEAIFRIIGALLLGQLASFLVAITNFCSSLNASLGIDAPLTLSFFSYLSLAIVYGSILLYRGQKLLVPWYWYLLIALLDVEYNYLSNKAFEYSSITSVTLLNCFAVAWVILLTWLLLGTHYSIWQLFGATVSVLGLAMVFISDARVGGGGGSKPFLGDILVICSTIFFALCNVGEEFCVKRKDLVEVIAMTGVFGMLASVVQISILERKSLESIEWTPEVILAFGGYALGNFTFYSLFPHILKMSGATMFNLSLLTANMWSVVIRIFFYKQKVDWLYYFSFGIVVIGLVIYSKSEKDIPPAAEEEDASSQYHLLNEENTSKHNL